MSKRIVVCTDGTWDNMANNTNVNKVSKSLTTSGGQVGYYDSGVGANGTPIFFGAQAHNARVFLAA